MIPGLDLLNASPKTRPILLVLAAVALAVQQLAPAHTMAHQIAGWVLAILTPLGFASVGKSHDLKDVDAEVAARGGPVAVLKGTKDE